MAKNSFQFDVALGKNNYIPIGEVKQSDTMDFSIRVLENDVVKNLTGDTCTLYVSKQDGTILEQKEGINITEATSGTLTIRVKNQATACPGMTFFELEFKGSDGIATSGTFLFTVNARLASGEAIQSKDEIQALEQVEKYVKEAKAELQKFKELQAAMLETNNSLNNQEGLRVEAESLRVTAEAGRVAAETKREEAFNKIEGRITANTEELKTARTATSGENFDSLDERIDAEVNRINKKIEISFLEQEDSESHTIENTIEGMTKNMVIKGKTLNNLITNGNLQGIINKAINSGSRLQHRNLEYELVPGKTYVGYINVTKYQGNISGGLRIYGNVANSASKITDKIGWNRFTWTIPLSLTSSISNIAIYLETLDFNNGGVVEFDSIMLFEENSQIDGLTTYLSGFKSFSEKEGKIIGLSNGKNLFDIEETKKATNSTVKFNEYDTIEFKQTAQDRVYLKCFGGFKAKTQYTLSLDIVSSKANVKFWIVYDDGTSTKFIDSPVTTEHGKTILRIQSDAPSEGENITTIIKNIQIEEGTKKTLYVKPIQYKKDILLREPLRELDYLYEDNGQVKIFKGCLEYRFNGSENLVPWSNREGKIGVTFSLSNKKNKGARAYCNKLCVYDKLIHGDGLTKQHVGVELINGNENIAISLSADDLTSADVEGVKNKLREWNDAGNPLTVIYELEIPIIEILENCDKLNLKTFNEKTHVSFENSLKGTSSFKVPVNAAATISRLSRENKALEEENLRLKKDTYKNSEDIILTNEELQITQSAVDHLLFGAVETSMLYNGKKKGGGSMGAYLAMRIIKGKLKYDAVMKQYGEFKEDIDMILKAEGYDHLITQQ